MKFIVVVALVALFAICAESLPIESAHGCQLDKFVLAVAGVCPLRSEDQIQCVSTCGQIVIDNQEDCAFTQECCWTGNRCSMKRFPLFEEPEDDETSEKQLSRTKRQSDGTFKGTLESVRDQIRAGAEYSTKVGDDGRLTAGGSVYLPSGHYNARVGYEKKLWGGNFGANIGYGRGDRHPSFGLSWSKSWGRRR